MDMERDGGKVYYIGMSLISFFFYLQKYGMKSFRLHVPSHHLCLTIKVYTQTGEWEKKDKKIIFF